MRSRFAFAALKLILPAKRWGSTMCSFFNQPRPQSGMIPGMKTKYESESDLAVLTRHYLQWSELLHWRMPIDGIRTASGARRKNPLAGFPDWRGVTRRGRLWALELKRRDGGVISDVQLEWHDKLRRNNVIVGVADNFEAVKKFIDELKRDGL